jgi:hypothetical protein
LEQMSPKCFPSKKSSSFVPPLPLSPTPSAGSSSSFEGDSLIEDIKHWSTTNIVGSDNDKIDYRLDRPFCISNYQCSSDRKTPRRATVDVGSPYARPKIPSSTNGFSALDWKHLEDSKRNDQYFLSARNRNHNEGGRHRQSMIDYGTENNPKSIVQRSHNEKSI